MADEHYGSLNLHQIKVKRSYIYKYVTIANDRQMHVLK